MPTLSLSIGSNINPVANIRLAIAHLREEFGDTRCSTVFESESVGFDGANFMNLVVLVETTKSLGDINARLKDIENTLGRDRDQPRFSGRTMDIDILTFGDEEGKECGLSLPRDEISKNAFVLLPLSELLPDTIHLPSKSTYAQLWAGYDKSSQKLWPVKFDWDA